MNRVIQKVSDHVDEVLVVVSSEVQREEYSHVVDDRARIVIDLYDDGSPLVGALTGFVEAKGDYALVTGCDMPFIFHKVIRYMFNAGEGHDRAVFRWPNGWVELLIAVYKIKPSLDQSLDLYSSGNLKLRLILLNMDDVNMVPIKTLIMMDPDLLSLHDVDTEEALGQAKEILKRRQA